MAQKAQWMDTLVRDDRWSLKIYWLLFIALVVLLWLPVWSVHYLPLMDYPNHLARLHIIHNYATVPQFQSAYTILYEPIPNVAMDVLVPPMLYLTDVITAGKIFTSLTVLLFAYGCHLLGKTIHGRETWLALFSAFTSYNFMFLMGFLNFVFGLAMFMITFALWLTYHERWTWKSLVAVTVLAFLSYLSHLSAYSFLGFTFVTIVAIDCIKARRISTNAVISLLPLVPPVIAFFSFMHGSGRIGYVEWSNTLQKIKDFPSTLRTYDHVFDSVIVAALIVSFTFAYFLARKRTTDWRLQISAAVLVLLFLLCPKTLFTSWAADIRFLPPALLLIVMGVRLKLENHIGRTMALIALCALLVRTGNIWRNWEILDARTAEQVRLLEQLPRGARVYPIVFDEAKERPDKLWQRTARHTVHYATIYRETFVPSLFAIRGQQPVIFKTPPPSRGLEEERPLSAVNWKQVFDRYEYLWCCYPSPAYERFLSRHCTVFAQAGRLKIFRIEKDAAALSASRGVMSSK